MSTTHAGLVGKVFLCAQRSKGPDRLVIHADMGVPLRAEVKTLGSMPGTICFRCSSAGRGQNTGG